MFDYRAFKGAPANDGASRRSTYSITSNNKNGATASLNPYQ